MESTSPMNVQQSAPNQGAQIQRQINSEGVEGFAKMMASLLIQQLLQQMNKSLVGGSLFGNSHQAKMYQGMFTENLAETIANSGGIGLADMITRQLRQNFGDGATNDQLDTQSINTPHKIDQRVNLRDLEALKYRALLNREGIKKDE